MMLARLVLVINAAAFALFGAAFAVLPNAVAHLVTGSVFPSPSAVTDARAIYGGMALGVASCFWLASRGSRDVQRVGLLGSALTFGFIAASRLVGIAVDGAGNSMMYVLLASEILGTLLSVWAINSLSREASRRGD